ncbi:hypothetical protein FRC10_006150 [Ceratobasidium sp. 414]|nr:hypothetical protein FRC10_006150 [Ceratobasidium sp. 414]
MAIISVLYAYLFVPPTAWHPINSACLAELPKLFKLGLSGTGQVASDWWSWEFVALAASQLGSLALASQSVLLVSASIAFQTPFSLGMATSVRVGNMLGLGQAKKAKLAAETSIGIPLGVALAFWGHLSLKGLWIGLAAALFFAATVSVWAVSRTDWDKEVERAKERLGRDEESEDEASVVSEA